jgi:hypothetical protein
VSTGSTNGSLGSPRNAKTAWIEALQTFNSRISRAVNDATASQEKQTAVADLRTHLPHLTTTMLSRLADLDRAESE